jgi:hypothetical protein
MPRKQSCLLADVPLPRGAARKPEVRLDLDETDAAGEEQQPAQESASLLLRIDAIVIAGAAVSAAPNEPAASRPQGAVIRPTFYSCGRSR